MTVDVEAIDRRTIIVKFPASPSELANALSGVAEEGYQITGASLDEAGGQRDPYTVGVRIVVTRGPGK